MKFKEMKVHVPTAEISQKVQEALFKLGYKWNWGSTGIEMTSSKYLFIHLDKFGYTSCSDYFRDHHYKEVYWEEIVYGLPEGGFQVGDKVRAFGLDGVVIGTVYTVSYPILVEFEVEGSRKKEDAFTRDGMFHACHKEPSLQFISRPPKLIKHTFYVWSCNGKIQTTLMDEQFRDVTGKALVISSGDYKKIEGTKVELEVPAALFGGAL